MGCQHVEFELLGQVRLGQLPEQSTVGLADGIDQQIAALDGQDIAEGFAGFRKGGSFDIWEVFLPTAIWRTSKETIQTFGAPASRHCCRTMARRSSSRPMMMTLADCWERAKASARPRPLDPPLMTAVRFFQDWLDPIGGLSNRPLTHQVQQDWDPQFGRLGQSSTERLDFALRG